MDLKKKKEATWHCTRDYYLFLECLQILRQRGLLVQMLTHKRNPSKFRLVEIFKL